MVISPNLQNLVTDIWIKASWEEFMVLAEDPNYTNGRFYYYQGSIRIEMSPVGFRHGRHNSIIPYVVILFAALKNIQIIEVTNTSFRKAGLDEFQPDLSYYIGSGLRVPPETDSPVDLNEYDPPTLVVEIGASSLSDDLGRKRLMYERVGIQEYWVVDTKLREIVAFTIADRHSGEIKDSLVLPGLAKPSASCANALVESALKRSQTEDDGEINRWLLQTFSQN